MSTHKGQAMQPDTQAKALEAIRLADEIADRLLDLAVDDWPSNQEILVAVRKLASLVPAQAEPAPDVDAIAKQVVSAASDLGIKDADELYAEVVAAIADHWPTATPPQEAPTAAVQPAQDPELIEWLKDGETVLERLKRERRDCLLAMEMLAGERKQVEMLRAKLAAAAPTTGDTE